MILFSSIVKAFNPVEQEHIMRDVNNGWLIRYLHALCENIFIDILNIKNIGLGLYTINNTYCMVLSSMNDVVTVYLLQDYNSYYSLQSFIFIKR